MIDTRRCGFGSRRLTSLIPCNFPRIPLIICTLNLVRHRWLHRLHANPQKSARNCCQRFIVLLMLRGPQQGQRRSGTRLCLRRFNYCASLHVVIRARSAENIVPLFLLVAVLISGLPVRTRLRWSNLQRPSKAARVLPDGCTEIANVMNEAAS